MRAPAPTPSRHRVAPGPGIVRFVRLDQNRVPALDGRAPGHRQGSESLATSPELADVEVSSAGPRASIGSAMRPYRVTAFPEPRGDPAGSRARMFEPRLAELADLQLAVTCNTVLLSWDRRRRA
jgi:hypothetical protein